MAKAKPPLIRFEDLPTRVRCVIRAILEQHPETCRDDVLSDDRRPVVVRVRWRIFWTLYKMPWGNGHPSLPEIGRWLGRDHSSVHHGIKGFEGIENVYREPQRLNAMARAYELARQEYRVDHPHATRETT